MRKEVFQRSRRLGKAPETTVEGQVLGDGASRPGFQHCQFATVAAEGLWPVRHRSPSHLGAPLKGAACRHWEGEQVCCLPHQKP